MRASNVARLLQMDEDLKNRQDATPEPAPGADPYNTSGRLTRQPATPRPTVNPDSAAANDRNSQTGALRILRRALDLMRSTL